MKTSALLFVLALFIEIVTIAWSWPSERNTSLVWGLATLLLLGLSALSVLGYLRIWRTERWPKVLLGLSIGPVILFLFAFMQWASFYK